MQLNRLKIAIVCDWLTNIGGAEKVILALHKLFPRAPIYTSIYNPKETPGFENAEIITSSLQNYPFAKQKHQYYLQMMPQAFERFNLSDFDIVISSSHSCAKGVLTKPETLHISYCHTPMRYAWGNSQSYIKEYNANPVVKFLAPHLMHKIRLWDKLSADRVDVFIANSQHVQKRIYKHYRKPSTVIYPFVETKKFKPSNERDHFYLAVGRLTPYKRFDLLVDTFNETGLPLKIVGTGVAMKKLKERAKSNIQFLGFVSDEKRNNLYQRAKALVFPQIEDFGITPLEAMASGCPVIAYAKGGALETVIDKKTGIFFKQQTPESLKRAIRKFCTTSFRTDTIRKRAEEFDIEIFYDKFMDLLEKKWKRWNDN